MAKKITHPILGDFITQCGELEGKISLPTWGRPPCRRHGDMGGDGLAGLTICAENYSISTKQVEAILAVRDAEARLVPSVLDALWNDFMGVGPDSGYWWHDNLAEVNEVLGWEGASVQTKEDLYKHFALQFVRVGHQSETAVELCLVADWEEEHGVGVLVEGGKVVGIGYQLDVEPFKS